MHTIAQDLRFAVRLLLKNPAFAGVAILVLALGIGANTAMFSVVNALVFRPIPSDGPGIVGIYSKDSTRPDAYRAFSWQAYEQIRSSRDVFDSVLAQTMSIIGVTDGETTRRSFASIVSANYFSTMSVSLAAGRGFTDEEERPGSDIRVVIVGHQFARKARVMPAEVLGRTVRLNSREYTIVGVTQEGFAGTIALLAPEFWLPTGVYERVADEMFRSGGTNQLADPKSRPLILVGRLRAGLTEQAAEPVLSALSQRMQVDNPAENRNQELLVHRLPRLSISTSPHSESEVTTLSALLMGMSGLVLLISCLNLANMLLARGTARRKEIALRLALGSGRVRVIRQLLTESLVLAVLGGMAGLGIAVWGTRLLVATLSTVMPLVVTFDASPDARVLAATMGFCVLSTIIAGLGPAWRVTRPDVLPDLKEQPAEHAGSRRLSMRNALVVGQVALSLALLTAAGLFMRGAVKASVADPGFPLAGGLLAHVDPGLVGYDEARGRSALLNILRNVRSTPGVQSASLASLVPFGEMTESRLVQKAGTPPAPAAQRNVGVDSVYSIVGRDYFDALQVPLVRGRGFTPAEEEAAGGTAVAVIDEPLSRQLFGGEDPVGHQIQFARPEESRHGHLMIVGVVGGIRHDMFDKVPVAHVYVPFGQNYRGNVALHVRIANAGAASAMLGTIRQRIRAADAAIPVVALKTLEQHRDSSIMLWAVNSGARLFSAFGSIALLLAVVGVYGVKSYVVSRRTREIGIRMALGASPGDVLWLVLREGLALTCVGIALGLLVSWGVAKALSGMLYEVNAFDPVVFAVAPVVLTAAALAASYLPARRATRVLPLSALRAE